MSDKAQNKIITPEAILSYPHLDKPVQGSDSEGKPSGTPKYSCALVFKPGSDLSGLQRAVKAAADAKWPGKLQELLAKHKASIQNGGPFIFRLPFRNDAKPGYPEGSTFVNVRTEQRPGLVYAHAAEATKKPALVPESEILRVFYAGAVVRASLTAYAYDKNGNKGVSLSLNNLQKIRDGERLDNRTAAEDEFTVDLSAAPADLAGLLD